MEINELIDKMVYIGENIFNNDVNIYDELTKISADIQKTYESYIQLIPQLIEIGMEIDINKIIEQLKHLSQAIEKKDKVMMFDTIRYEMLETMRFYAQILSIMEED